MGVLIKGMEMPTCCVLCRMSEYHVNNPYCKITEAKILRNRDRNNDCPLVPVPPHGRLIDADKIGLTDFEIILCQKGNPFKNALEMLLEKIENAPTIIPAEEVEA